MTSKLDRKAVQTRQNTQKWPLSVAVLSPADIAALSSRRPPETAPTAPHRRQASRKRRTAWAGASQHRHAWMGRRLPKDWGLAAACALALAVLRGAPCLAVVNVAWCATPVVDGVPKRSAVVGCGEPVVFTWCGGGTYHDLWEVDASGFACSATKLNGTSDVQQYSDVGNATVVLTQTGSRRFVCTLHCFNSAQYLKLTTECAQPPSPPSPPSLPSPTPPPQPPAPRRLQPPAVRRPPPSRKLPPPS